MKKNFCKKKETTAMKKCDKKKQNSIDIKTNQTLLKKNKPNPYSLKKPFAKNTLKKKTKNMERKPLFKENLYLEKKLLKENSNL